jgi:hypothetical protein
MRVFHGEGRKKNIRGIKLMILGEIFWLLSWEHCARDGQGGLGGVVATSSTISRYLFKVLINILLELFPSNLCLFTYVCLIDGFDWTNLIE